MEEGALFAAGKVDPLGYADSDSWDSCPCRCCTCLAFERDGESSVLLHVPSCVLTIVIAAQREDELERRRASHHINFDAL